VVKPAFDRPGVATRQAAQKQVLSPGLHGVSIFGQQSSGVWRGGANG